jgi:hypothetical protein
LLDLEEKTTMMEKGDDGLTMDVVMRILIKALFASTGNVVMLV